MSSRGAVGATDIDAEQTLDASDHFGADMTTLLKPKGGGRPIVVDKPIILIGRHPDCDIIIESSPKISRKHCCVARVDERCFVRDLESMNGIWVNGHRELHNVELFPGDVLMIGDVQFDVVTMKPAKPANRAPTPKPEPAPNQTVEVPDRKTVELDSDEKPEFFDEEMLRSADASEAIKFTESLSLPFVDDESGEGRPVAMLNDD